MKKFIDPKLVVCVDGKYVIQAQLLYNTFPLRAFVCIPATTMKLVMSTTGPARFPTLQWLSFIMRFTIRLQDGITFCLATLNNTYFMKGLL
jgi:hypothetical protein